MKIHFAALLGVDYDMDLAPHWIQYYLDRHLDSYTIVLHREQGEIPEADYDLFRTAGFKILRADGPFSMGCVRSAHLGNIADNLPRGDILVTADADEYQALSDDSPIDYREMFGRYDMLHGLHEDRYSHCLERCYTDPFKQYPIRERYTGEHYKILDIPFIEKDKSPMLIRTKILAAPVEYTVEFKGSHCLNGVPYNAKILYDCKVIHFAWREGAARKLALKTYFSLDNLKEIYADNVPEGLVNTYNNIYSIFNPKLSPT